MEAASKPEIGHVVVLNGGDCQAMVVEGYQGDNVCCVWMDTSFRIERDVFRPEVLTNRTLQMAEARRQREEEWRSLAEHKPAGAVKSNEQKADEAFGHPHISRWAKWR